MNTWTQRFFFIVFSCLWVACLIKSVPTTYLDSTQTDLQTTGFSVTDEVLLEKIPISTDKTEKVETVNFELEPIEIEQFEPASTTSQDDLWLLAHLIWGEAGSNWISDETQRYVASVVLNRVAHPYYPNTITDVLYQSGQYSCVWTSMFYNEPTQRCWDNARYVLENGSQLPESVVYQAGFVQGSGVYCSSDGILFCYW